MGVDVNILIFNSKFETDTELRRISAEICSRTDIYPYSEDHHILHEVADWSWYFGSEEEILKNEGEQVITCDTLWRYYGPGYERGPWAHIKELLSLLGHYFPNSRIYYGGDSSGIKGELVTQDFIKSINDHWLKYGHAPYRGYSSNYFNLEIPKCSFCVNRPMNNNGGGAGKQFWSCDGCNSKFIQTKTGLHKLDRFKDFFDWKENASKK